MRPRLTTHIVECVNRVLQKTLPLSSLEVATLSILLPMSIVSTFPLEEANLIRMRCFSRSVRVLNQGLLSNCAAFSVAVSELCVLLRPLCVLTRRPSLRCHLFGVLQLLHHERVVVRKQDVVQLHDGVRGKLADALRDPHEDLLRSLGVELPLCQVDQDHVDPFPPLGHPLAGVDQHVLASVARLGKHLGELRHVCGSRRGDKLLDVLADGDRRGVKGHVLVEALQSEGRVAGTGGYARLVVLFVPGVRFRDVLTAEPA
eukprot:11228345-Lingulodinium_polyedra.AAC.2